MKFEEMRNQVTEGDCLSVMKLIPDKSIDLVLTDPPYGTTQCKWDIVIPFELMWKELKRIRKDKCPIIIFGNEPFSSILRISNIKEFKYDWVWDKQLKTGHLNAKKCPMGQHEIISVFGKGAVNYYPIMESGAAQHGEGKRRRTHSQNYGKQTNEYNDKKGNTLKYPSTLSIDIQKVHPSKCVHPTQKPVALMEYLIKTYSNNGDIVLDFAAGSGTTGVAAKNLGRDFILIEKEPKYVEICKKRLQQEVLF